LGKERGPDKGRRGLILGKNVRRLSRKAQRSITDGNRGLAQGRDKGNLGMDSRPWKKGDEVVASGEIGEEEKKRKGEGGGAVGMSSVDCSFREW